MKISCPTCNAISEVEDQFGGQTAECPACNQELVIPMPSAPRPILKPVPRAKSEDGSFAIGLVRCIRGFIGLLFGLQVFGMLPVFTWASNPGGIRGEMVAALLLKAVFAAIFWAIFAGLRSTINSMHQKRFGTHHPVLGTKKWAL
jgi:hypothetical protein